MYLYKQESTHLQSFLSHCSACALAHISPSFTALPFGYLMVPNSIVATPPVSRYGLASNPSNLRIISYPSQICPIDQ